MKNKIRNATNIVLIFITKSDANWIVPEMIIVTIKIVTTQRIVLLRSFFDADGSDLGKGLSPLKF